jgi:hypothetical protein
VPVGFLRLEPDSKAGNVGPSTVAEIHGGRYSTPPGNGIVGGKYRAFLSGYDGVAYDIPHEGYREPLGKPLFTDHAQEVEFPRTQSIHDFQLTGP